MNIVKFFCLVLLIIFVAACSRGEDCLVADSMKQVQVLTVEDKPYFLFVRTTGFNEKVHFYELYKKLPVFDVCGKSPEMPFAELHIDDSKGDVQKIILKDNQLTAVYSESTGGGVNLLEITVEVQ